MSSALESDPSKGGIPASRKNSSFYYGWVCVWVAAFAMVATFPGRTVGLGLVTEPMLRDLQLTHGHFGVINFWATLLGAGFGLGAGRLLDRFGSRAVMTLTVLFLGLVTLWMSGVSGYWDALLTITLTRGFGQSALSAVSISLVGKWFERKVDHAMATYAVILSIGFVVAVTSLEGAVKAAGWRSAWAGMGWVILVGMTAISGLLARDSPERMGLKVDGGGERAVGDQEPPHGLTLLQTVSTPAFWAFSLGGLLFNVTHSGLTLFNESILKERGFTGSPTTAMAAMLVTGLISNFLAGWISSRWSISRLMAVGMVVLAVSLGMLPWIRSTASVVAYGAVLGVSGGIVTVVFFSCWSKVFGRLHLGKIQGAAQAVSVLASALGPWLLAGTREVSGSYNPLFLACVPLALLMAVWCWLVRLPSLTPDNA